MLNYYGVVIIYLFLKLHARRVQYINIQTRDVVEGLHNFREFS